MILTPGVFIPAAQCPALASLTRLGARVRAERDGGAPLHPDVVELLDQLVRVAQAMVTQTSAMSEPGHVPHAGADIEASSTVRLGPVVTVPAAAGLISVSERHARRLVRSGELEGHKHGNVWSITRSSIDEYLGRSR